MSAVVVRVEAVPGAHREKIERLPNGTYRIAVREDAQGGLANERIRMLLAQTLRVRATQVRLRTGAHSRRKRFDVILEGY